jgi:hypothetical protein
MYPASKTYTLLILAQQIIIMINFSNEISRISSLWSQGIRITNLYKQIFKDISKQNHNPAKNPKTNEPPQIFYSSHKK